MEDTRGVTAKNRVHPPALSVIPQETVSYNWDRCGASPVAQTVKALPAMQGTWARSLGWEDSTEGMAARSSVRAWRIPRTEEPGGLQSRGSQRAGQDCATNTSSGHYANIFLCKIYTDTVDTIPKPKIEAQNWVMDQNSLFLTVR